MTLLCWLVEGLSEHCSLSIDIWLSLKRLYYFIICLTPMTLSPKGCWILQVLSIWVSQSFDATSLLKLFCHFITNKHLTDVHNHTHGLIARDWCSWHRMKNALMDIFHAFPQRKLKLDTFWKVNMAKTDFHFSNLYFYY